MEKETPGEDYLFLALTKPQMKMGVTVGSMVLNMMVVAMIVNLTSNPLMMLICIPIHGVFFLICQIDPFFFDILFQGIRLKIYKPGKWLAGAKAYVGN